MSVFAKEDLLVLNALKEEICRQANSGCEQLDMAPLLKISHWSRRQTERRFRERFFTSPARYFRDCQWEVAEELLHAGDDVLSASQKSGFASPGRLHDAAVVRRGMSPGEMRRKGAGVQITYGYFETQIGVVLIAATKRGMCAMRLCGVHGERMDEELENLRNRFPDAELERDTPAVQSYADQLVAFLDERTGAEFCPPIDVLVGTTFQREVWSELQKLKPGETATYAEIAERIGKPKAVRAVASACANNELAIAIPCHRVIRTDGTLAGYRWGVEWKRRLLEIEAERAERLKNAAHTQNTHKQREQQREQRREMITA
jgi:AraC family transcriptional regulator, regulatory protein of adaptative response / methylated-DNA-[protein]-cysteine methyltransferase